jgi:hypothetical protein
MTRPCDSIVKAFEGLTTDRGTSGVDRRVKGRRSDATGEKRCQCSRKRQGIWRRLDNGLGFGLCLRFFCSTMAPRVAPI